MSTRIKVVYDPQRNYSEEQLGLIGDGAQVILQDVTERMIAIQRAKLEQLDAAQNGEGES